MHNYFTFYTYFSSILVILALLYFIIKFKTLNKVVIFGILFFFITISIALQIIPCNFTFISERYTYLPYIGLFYIITYFIFKLLNSSVRSIKIIILITIATYIIILSAITFNRIKVWHDNMALWSDVINKYPYSPYAYYYRGGEKYSNLDYTGAISDFSMAKSIKDFVFNDINYYFRACAEVKINNINAAILDLDSAISISNDFFEAYDLRADLKTNFLKNDSSALNDYYNALKLRYSPEVFFKLGNLQFKHKDAFNACINWHKSAFLGNIDAKNKIKLYCK